MAMFNNNLQKNPWNSGAGSGWSVQGVGTGLLPFPLRFRHWGRWLGAARPTGTHASPCRLPSPTVAQTGPSSLPPTSHQLGTYFSLKTVEKVNGLNWNGSLFHRRMSWYIFPTNIVKKCRHINILPEDPSVFDKDKEIYAYCTLDVFIYCINASLRVLDQILEI